MDNPFSLTGKTILVTGASSGIGRQTCISIANMGGVVIASARNEDRLNETLSMLPGDNHKIIKAELTDTNDIDDLVRNIDKVNGVVHSAGLIKLVPLKFYTKDNIRHFNDINYEAPILLTSVLTKKRKLADSASIIFISSIANQLGTIGNGLYAGTKGALVGITKVLAKEVAGKKIRVNCVSPGMIETAGIDSQTFKKEIELFIQKQPLGPGTPEDIANACIFLLSDASRWVTGTNLIIDGGYLAL